MSKRTQKLIKDPTPEQVEAAAKAGRPLLLMPSVGELVTVDRVQMLPGGARRKVHAGSWHVRRLGTDSDAGCPVLTLEAFGRNDLVENMRRPRRYTWRDLALGVALGASAAAAVAAVIVWVVR